jgi:hypothetical protein
MIQIYRSPRSVSSGHMPCPHGTTLGPFPDADPPSCPPEHQVLVVDAQSLRRNDAKVMSPVGEFDGSVDQYPAGSSSSARNRTTGASISTRSVAWEHVYHGSNDAMLNTLPDNDMEEFLRSLGARPGSCCRRSRRRCFRHDIWQPVCREQRYASLTRRQYHIQECIRTKLIECALVGPFAQQFLQCQPRSVQCIQRPERGQTRFAVCVATGF